jgi:hypothetical protein
LQGTGSNDVQCSSESGFYLQVFPETELSYEECIYHIAPIQEINRTEGVQEDFIGRGSGRRRRGLLAFVSPGRGDQ